MANNRLYIVGSDGSLFMLAKSNSPGGWRMCCNGHEFDDWVKGQDLQSVEGEAETSLTLETDFERVPITRERIRQVEAKALATAVEALRAVKDRVTDEPSQDIEDDEDALSDWEHGIRKSVWHLAHDAIARAAAPAPTPVEAPTQDEQFNDAFFDEMVRQGSPDPRRRISNVTKVYPLGGGEAPPKDRAPKAYSSHEEAAAAYLAEMNPPPKDEEHFQEDARESLRVALKSSRDAIYMLRARTALSEDKHLQAARNFGEVALQHIDAALAATAPASPPAPERAATYAEVMATARRAREFKKETETEAVRAVLEPIFFDGQGAVWGATSEEIVAFVKQLVDQVSTKPEA